MGINLETTLGVALLFVAPSYNGGYRTDISQGGHVLTSSANTNAPTSPPPKPRPIYRGVVINPLWIRVIYGMAIGYQRKSDLASWACEARREFAREPIVLNSRADSARTACCVLVVLVARAAVMT